MQGLLVVQALSLLLEHRLAERYTLSLWAASAGLIVLLSTGAKASVLLHSKPKVYSNTEMILTLAQLSVCVFATSALSILAGTAGSLRRWQACRCRAHMFCHGRYTCSWAAPTLVTARENKHVAVDVVFYLFRSAFLRQLALTVITSVTKIGPQYAMFNSLKLLEGRSQGTQVTNTALLWVSALALCMFFNPLVESWLLSLGWSQIAIPIRTMLSILIFAKFTRRKNAQAGQQDEPRTRIDAAPSAYSGIDEFADGESLPKDQRR